MYAQSNEEKLYEVLKVRNEKSVYVIYVKKNDTTYKVVSQKQKVLKIERNIKLQKGNSYKLYLKSLTRPLIINGVDVTPTNFLDVPCHNIWGQVVCIEPDKGIFDLYEAQNLKGLYITPACSKGVKCDK